MHNKRVSRKTLTYAQITGVFHSFAVSHYDCRAAFRIPGNNCQHVEWDRVVSRSRYMASYFEINWPHMHARITVAITRIKAHPKRRLKVFFTNLINLFHYKFMLNFMCIIQVEFIKTFLFFLWGDLNFNTVILRTTFYIRTVQWDWPTIATNRNNLTRVPQKELGDMWHSFEKFLRSRFRFFYPRLWNPTLVRNNWTPTNIIYTAVWHLKIMLLWVVSRP